MKAILKTQKDFGAEYKDIPIPEPEADEVLIRVLRAAICGTDIGFYNWTAGGAEFADRFDAKLPFVLGHECSGQIIKLGKNVKNRKIGQRVSIETHIPCGQCYMCQNAMPHNCENMRIYGTSCDGCFAEYATVPADVTFLLPDNVDDTQGALFEPGGVAMRAVEEINARPGDTIVVNGCGPIGLMAIMLLLAGNAARVIAVDLDEYRLQMAKEFGAIPINLKRENSVEIVQDLTKERGGADGVIEVSGAPSAYQTIFSMLRPEGRLVTVGHPGSAIPIDIMRNVNLKGLELKGVFGRKIWETWWSLAGLIESGKVNLKKVVTHSFKLEQFDEAFAQIHKGAGKVVFEIGEVE